MSRRPTMRWALAISAAAGLLPPPGWAAQAPLAPFPAAGTAALHRSGRDLAAGLSQPANAAGQTSVPVLATDRTAFSLMRRAAPNNPLAHPGWTEVFYIVDGGGIFESGGTVTRTPGADTVTYVGSVEQHVKKGDVVVIPEGAPHRYRSLDGSVTYLEVRFPNEPGSLPAPSSTPAPAPGTSAIVYDGDRLAAGLAAAARTNSAQATQPVLVTNRYAIDIVRRGARGAPTVHPGWNELHYILEGGATFTSGGKLAAGRIDGGTPLQVKAGDALIVPADSPHQYSAVDGAVTYFEVRIPNAPPTPRG